MLDAKLHTMSSGKGTLKIFSTRKNTGFKIQSRGTGLKRRVDQYNQIVYCVNCRFTAPLSASYEHFIWLHEKYNHIIGGNSPCSYKITNSDEEDEDEIIHQGSKLIKCIDEDKTCRNN
ncbi:hypothetical protein [Rachiplusia nu nucleopolyhedrovirus]|uniref:Uncharacterized protein n=1 Tax=Rachiplusia nu nucleopolyhedrovirus TaxID=2605775 RepID=A0AAE6IQL7_9ABAC|nr:hypothetical protein QKQ55_gp048 [Rachiplusia nu nucleopolyhedrovirus]QEI03598.1 hypothetical protein [Rachiplusia nu nucleopolyhedrovirus]